MPDLDGRKCVAFAFSRDILVPKGIRLFGMAGKPFVVPGKAEGTTAIFVHPDDYELLLAAAMSPAESE